MPEELSPALPSEVRTRPARRTITPVAPKCDPSAYYSYRPGGRCCCPATDVVVVSPLTPVTQSGSLTSAYTWRFDVGHLDVCSTRVPASGTGRGRRPRPPARGRRDHHPVPGGRLGAHDPAAARTRA